MTGPPLPMEALDQEDVNMEIVLEDLVPYAPVSPTRAADPELPNSDDAARALSHSVQVDLMNEHQPSNLQAILATTLASSLSGRTIWASTPPSSTMVSTVIAALEGKQELMYDVLVSSSWHRPANAVLATTPRGFCGYLTTGRRPAFFRKTNHPTVTGSQRRAFPHRAPLFLSISTSFFDSEPGSFTPATIPRFKVIPLYSYLLFISLSSFSVTVKPWLKRRKTV